MYFKMVFSEVQSSNLMLYPTSLPSLQPTSSATRAATLMAATLLGCVHPIFPSLLNPVSWRYCGIWVLFPLPVSPTMMRTWYSSTALRRSSRYWKIGRLALVAAILSLSVFSSIALSSSSLLRSSSASRAMFPCIRSSLMNSTWSSNTKSYSLAPPRPRPPSAPTLSLAWELWCLSQSSCSLKGLPSSPPSPPPSSLYLSSAAAYLSSLVCSFPSSSS
mmetsp:Transcript_3940/g.14150  ORF Transcript_3940/g.14150 Transcript_3940/m.14150 type:complete len:218 (+) Transcript_3940:1766-2419(+)